ncbi:MAG: TraB/GumN family protein [Bacteroidetes bacterium]|nr:TraB/GumN family protein [Bacteroidota bacterium]
MKRLFVLIAVIIFFLPSFSQIKIKNKKYPSLLWEINGNGIKKPSYLFGTMHISSKVVFNLADSFYTGIKNANVVALETNPESWQEDMSKYDLSNNYMLEGRYGNFDQLPNDYLSIHTLEFGKYEKKIEQALYSNPAVINNLLYRTYGDFSSDFEENTYLDMYIYQVGKKWGKKVAGVENYGESMKLMMEAYKDAAKDKDRRERSYDAENGFSADKLQEAYRAGNLDLLDSLNKLQSFSNAFDEKFLYRRNEIQANSIDSILKSGSSLFVGVGAAHLPGSRGVIEILRQRGYSLRPVIMEKKADSRQKDSVEKLHVPVVFSTYTADDGFFKVDIPGKLYGADNSPGMFDQRQYADMANGSYYIVTRLRTNNVMWGHGIDEIYKKIDSVLYENIPGKILNKQTIYRNGYKGFDILNRTRRGDVQRYNIFITPFEIIFFKMSGNDEYVKNGKEANLFFNSIKLKDYNNTGWKKYSPPFGGFSVQLPHDAFVSNDGSWLFDAEDKSDYSRYRIVRTDIHNYHFAEVDTFDLSLMEESFKSSEYIDKEINRQQTNWKGYPVLDCQFLGKDGSIFATRFIIQGPHYYSLISHSEKENPKTKLFFDSFEIKPFVYGQPKERKDTALYYSVLTPVFPELKKEKLEFPNQYDYLNNDDDDKNEKDALEKGIYRNKIISNDSTGQKVYVSFNKYGRYHYESDSSWLNRKNLKSYLGGDSTWIVRKLKSFNNFPDKMRVWEYELTKKGSSRIFLKKDFYKNGISFSLITESDSLTEPDNFIRTFFNSFTPADTLRGISPFTSKSKDFFEDFFSSDSIAHRRAVKSIDEFDVSASDLQQFKKAIGSFSWEDKKYLDTKKSFISKLKDIDSKESSDYLKHLYYAAGDTVEIQYTVLETLLQQQTKYSISVFRDIITEEPPVLQTDKVPDYSNYTRWNAASFYKKYQISNGDFMDELYDSLKLTKTILPGLLPLLNLDDYKWPVMKLLARMVDSNLVATRDYSRWLNKFLLEAKLELKKQLIAEKKKAIKKAEDSRMERPSVYSAYDKLEDKDKGNDDLSIYATLLLPYRDKNASVQTLFQQLLQSGDDELKYSIMFLLLRNNKEIPDSLPAYFAAKEKYRYELYSDLKEISRSEKFPDKYNNHLDLAKSKLLDTKLYDKPDSLVYLDRLQAALKSNKGFVYFFKYKKKKDDDIWSIASVGLVPEDPKQFEFDNETGQEAGGIYYDDYISDFTELSDTKLRDDEPEADQLKTALKKLLYSTHSSAKNFYDKEEGGYNLNGNRKF